jgi:predicted nuclease of predicted toxin-antitoxin system
MNFFADESCPDPVIDALVAAGHDVVRAASVMQGAQDEAVLAAATAANRIVIAQDRDFGELIVRRGLAVSGYVLLRLKGRDWPRIGARVVEAIGAAGDLERSVLVIEWTMARKRPLSG